MSDCIFCKIANKEIPAKIAYENHDVLAFFDLSPQAPMHILFIPKKHTESLSTIHNDHMDLGGLMNAINEYANAYDIQGYRVVTNIGNEGGQTVKHLHFHFLAGRQMHWPPG